MQSQTLLLSQTQLWIVVIGVFTPIVSYLLNNKVLRRFWEGLPEPIAGMIHVLVAAVAAGIYEAVETSQFGWNPITLQYVVTAVVASFVAHGMVWKPVGVQPVLTTVSATRWRWQRVPLPPPPNTPSPTPPVPPSPPAV